MGNFINIRGQRFGRLVVIKLDRKVGREASRGTERGTFWKCRCDCGTQKIVNGTRLRFGHTQSCGCLSREITSAMFKKHGMCGSREYKAWCQMKARCENPNASQFEFYGGRGIKVCLKWRNSFEVFFADMGKCPDNHSLDRWPNFNGNYKPGNCRWATKQQQAQNRRKRTKFPSRNALGIFTGAC